MNSKPRSRFCLLAFRTHKTIPTTNSVSYYLCIDISLVIFIVQLIRFLGWSKIKRQNNVLGGNSVKETIIDAVQCATLSPALAPQSQMVIEYFIFKKSNHKFLILKQNIVQNI